MNNLHIYNINIYTTKRIFYNPQNYIVMNNLLIKLVGLFYKFSNNSISLNLIFISGVVLVFEIIDSSSSDKFS